MRGCWNLRSYMRLTRGERQKIQEPKNQRTKEARGRRRCMNDLDINKSIWVSRRTMLRLAATSAVAGASGAAWAQEAKTARGELAPLNRFSRMVQEWFVDQVLAAEDKIKQRLAALKTKDDAEGYVRSVQQRVRESFGPEPERTPLNARVTGVVERDTYRIEKVIFESRPNFPV